MPETSTPRSLGLVTSDIISSAHIAVARGAESVAAEHRYSFMVGLTHGDLDREHEIVARMCDSKVAGLILTDTTLVAKESDERIARYFSMLDAIGARLVLCGHPPLSSLTGVLTVNYNQVGGVRKVVQYLVSQGHSRIAFLGCGTSALADQRFLGYTLGLQDAGVGADSSLMVECRDETVDSHLAALLLLRNPNPPTAVICLTDSIAVGVYRAARDFGIEIPGQLAIVGFDDSPYAGDLTPGLTSIQVPYVDLGATAATLALHVGDVDAARVLPAQVLVRGSTG